MSNKLFRLFLLLMIILLAFPAFASTATTVTFDDAQNKVIGTTSYTFKGTITTTEPPETLTYQFQVYKWNTATLIDQSVTNRTVNLTNSAWTYQNGVFTNTFEFTAQFGTNTGAIGVYLEVWKGNIQLAGNSLKVNVNPLQLTLTQKNNLAITQRNYEFTGTIKSYTNNPVLSYKVLDRHGNTIDQSSNSKPVTLTSWAYDATTQQYSGNLKFTADFGSYTGTAQVVLQATDGTITATKTISVTVSNAAPITQTQETVFKNRGQLVSYLTKQLQIRGSGIHKNHGKALTYCLKHSLISNVKTTAEADRFITVHVLGQ